MDHSTSWPPNLMRTKSNFVDPQLLCYTMQYLNRKSNVASVILILSQNTLVSSTPLHPLLQDSFIMTTRPARKSPSSLLSATKASSARTRSSPRLAKPKHLSKPTGVDDLSGIANGPTDLDAATLTKEITGGIVANPSDVAAAGKGKDTEILESTSNITPSPVIKDSAPGSNAGLGTQDVTEDAVAPSRPGMAIGASTEATTIGADPPMLETASTSADDDAFSSNNIEGKVLAQAKATVTAGAAGAGPEHASWAVTIAKGSSPNLETNIDPTNTSPSPKNLYNIFASNTPSKSPTLTSLGKPCSVSTKPPAGNDIDVATKTPTEASADAKPAAVAVNTFSKTVAKDTYNDIASDGATGLVAKPSLAPPSPSLLVLSPSPLTPLLSLLVWMRPAYLKPGLMVLPIVRVPQMCCLILSMLVLALVLLLLMPPPKLSIPIKKALLPTLLVTLADLVLVLGLAIPLL